MVRARHEHSTEACLAGRFLGEICASLGLAESLERVRFYESGDLVSAFPVSDFAAAAVGAAGVATSELIHALFADSPAVSVDRRLASAWYGLSIRPIGWSGPAAWDPIAGDYEARDGWIRLHTNAPRHREAALRVLGSTTEKAAVTAAVRRWSANDLESAIVAQGGCAATMRSLVEWSTHPQGAAVAAEPIVHIQRSGLSSLARWGARRDRPLYGLRVLDCTWVLAGPVATRFLAGFGAEILRIDPPDWDEPSIAPEVTLGKRCARLDIKTREGCERFAALLADADVFVHGLRPDALDALPRVAVVAGRPGRGLAERGATVCSCFGVGANQIAAAAKAGCLTVEAMGQALQAGTNCGSCRAEIKGIINAYRLQAAE
jgi:bacterioferritin-associated ferredoxin